MYGSPRCNLAALADTPDYTYAAAKITPVFNGNPAVQKVEREYLFIKPSTFVVFDRVASAAGTKRIWTLNLPGAPVINGNQLTFTGAKSNRMDVYRVAPAGLAYTSNVPAPTDGDSMLDTKVRRVDVLDAAAAQSNFLHIIATNTVNSPIISGVTRSDATGQTGAQFTLSDGRAVTVRFANATTGGTLEIRNAAGVVQVSGLLPTTVVAPPVFRK